MSRRARLQGRIVSHHPVVPGNTPQKILDDILPLRRPESAHHESLWWNMQRLARDRMVCSSALEHGLCQGVEEKARHQDQSPGWMVTTSSIPRYPSNWLRMNTKVTKRLQHSAVSALSWNSSSLGRSTGKLLTASFHLDVTTYSGTTSFHCLPRFPYDHPQLEDWSNRPVCPYPPLDLSMSTVQGTTPALQDTIVNRPRILRASGPLTNT